MTLISSAAAKQAIAALLLAVVSPLPAQDLRPPVAGTQLDGLAPGAALANFRAYEGFRIVQSVAEPGVCQPVAMAIDRRGRVWVAEAYEYPIRAKGDAGRDRILIFEDKDGDGIFDGRKVFAEGLNLVSGLEIGFGGVWVGAAPYLMFIPDADGDDKPDGKPEILLDGFGWQDTHETLNSFIWGPDGWLYGCHGVFTHSRVGRPGTPDAERVPINAGVWRYHPTRKTFEVFANGTSNPWGVDFNDHGQAFITACVVPHLYHVIQGARYQRQAGRHFDPHTYEDIRTCADHLHYKGDQWAGSRDGSSSDFGGGHAHCGLSIYLGDNFPDAFRGKLLFNNLHGHRVNQEMVERKGSGYVGRHQPDFLFSNDRQHMGVTLKYGPDGGLFLTDWYDSQTCHNVNGEIWNRSNGRIYKITYGTPDTQPVDLRKSTDKELVGLQGHRNDWHVRMARLILQERAAAGRLDSAETSRGLRELLGSPDETRRLRALWALHAIGAMDEAGLLAATRDGGEYVRGWAIQLLVERPAASSAVSRRFAEMAVSDPSALVRLYLAAALQRMPAAARWEIAGGLLAHGGDAADHNLPLMVWYGVSGLVDEDMERATRLAVDARIPKVRELLARRLSGSEKGRDLVLAAAVGHPDIAADLLRGLAAAVAKEGNLSQPPGWAAASGVFEGLADEDARGNFELVATVFGDSRMAEKFRRTITDAAATKEQRLSAMENLARMKDQALPSLLMDLAGRDTGELRPEWLRGLGLAKDGRIPAFLSRLLPALEGRAKESAVQTLASTEEGARMLADGLAAGTIRRGDVSAFVARQMRAYDKPDITGAVESHWGAVASGQGDGKAKEIEKYLKKLGPKVLAGADLRNGRQLFQGTCYACHQLFGEGMKIGPDLTGSNRADTRYLLENIIDPSSLVGLDYQLHTITKNDGQVVAGLLKEDTPSALSVMTLGGSGLVLQKVEIRDHKISSTSMMPEGLLANLTDIQTRDLIGYLQSPEQVPLPVPGEIVIADDRIMVAEVNRGAVEQQNMAGFRTDSWSGGSQLWWTGGQPGDRIVLQFESPDEGRYVVTGVFTKAFDYGIVRMKLNGDTANERMDLYEKSKVITTGEVRLGTHAIRKGANQLVVEMLGRNPQAAPQFMFGIDHLTLAPE